MREVTGKREEEVTLPGGATLRDMMQWINTHYKISLPDPNIITLLNGRGFEQYPEEYEKTLKTGDIIFIMPPVAGG
jgi:MoaD family protein